MAVPKVISYPQLFFVCSDCFQSLEEDRNPDPLISDVYAGAIELLSDLGRLGQLCASAANLLSYSLCNLAHYEVSGQGVTLTAYTVQNQSLGTGLGYWTVTLIRHPTDLDNLSEDSVK